MPFSVPLLCSFLFIRYTFLIYIHMFEETFLYKCNNNCTECLTDNGLLCFSYINAMRRSSAATCVLTIISHTTSVPAPMVLCVYRRIMRHTMFLNCCIQVQHTREFVPPTERDLDILHCHSVTIISRNAVCTYP